MPERIQLSRTKGWRMPPNTVKVDRSTRWGNPFRVVYEGGGVWEVVFDEDVFGEFHSKNEAADYAVRLFETTTEFPATRSLIRGELAGKNLACWCPLDQPCHADILLEIANKDTA